jgi:hypothetical protein
VPLYCLTICIFFIDEGRAKKKKFYQFLLKIECSGSWFRSNKLQGGGGRGRVYVVETILGDLLKPIVEGDIFLQMHLNP